MLNKQTSQTLVLYGTFEHAPAERNIAFGLQLMNQFKPVTIMINEQPLQIAEKDAATDPDGVF